MNFQPSSLPHPLGYLKGLLIIYREKASIGPACPHSPTVPSPPPPTMNSKLLILFTYPKMTSKILYMNLGLQWWSSG